MKKCLLNFFGLFVLCQSAIVFAAESCLRFPGHAVTSATFDNISSSLFVLLREHNHMHSKQLCIINIRDNKFHDVKTIDLFLDPSSTSPAVNFIPERLFVVHAMVDNKLESIIVIQSRYYQYPIFINLNNLEQKTLSNCVSQAKYRLGAVIDLGFDLTKTVWRFGVFCSDNIIRLFRYNFSNHTFNILESSLNCQAIAKRLDKDNSLENKLVPAFGIQDLDTDEIKPFFYWYNNLLSGPWYSFWCDELQRAYVWFFYRNYYDQQTLCVVGRFLDDKELSECSGVSKEDLVLEDLLGATFNQDHVNIKTPFLNRKAKQQIDQPIFDFLFKKWVKTPAIEPNFGLIIPAILYSPKDTKPFLIGSRCGAGTDVIDWPFYYPLVPNTSRSSNFDIGKIANLMYPYISAGNNAFVPEMTAASVPYYSEFGQRFGGSAVQVDHSWVFLHVKLLRADICNIFAAKANFDEDGDIIDWSEWKRIASLKVPASCKDAINIQSIINYSHVNQKNNYVVYSATVYNEGGPLGVVGIEDIECESKKDNTPVDCCCEE